MMSFEEKMKEEVFFRIGLEVHKVKSTIKFFKRIDEPKMKKEAMDHMMGLETAVEALGYDLDEFWAYCKSHRKEFADHISNFKNPESETE